MWSIYTTTSKTNYTCINHKIDAEDFMLSSRENNFFLPTGTKNELIV